MDEKDTLLNDFLELYQTARDDFITSAKELERDSSFYNRRIYFMTAFAMFEAIIYSFKNASLDLHEGFSKRIIKKVAEKKAPILWGYLEPRLSDEELILLKGQLPNVDDKGNVRLAPLFIPFERNLRMSFNLFLKVINSTFRPDYSDNNWDCLKKSAKVRNRVTHPKHSRNFQITDAEIEHLQKGAAWFLNTYQGIIESFKLVLTDMKDEKDSIEKSQAQQQNSADPKGRAAD